ncbi:MAG: DUF4825 domain-containing protein [Peptoniphilus sp.]|nr:DUF4825 domain-containing protein [Peptoniphilus sp.]
MFNKFSKLLPLFILLLSLTACLTAESKTLYDYRTQYVGDNSKTVNLVSQLHFGESLDYDHTAIKSEDNLNILELYFTSESEEVNDELKLSLFKANATLHALIENLDQIDIYINSEKSYTTDKKEIESRGIFLKNFDEYFSSEEYYYEFENELKEIEMGNLNKLSMNSGEKSR